MLDSALLTTLLVSAGTGIPLFAMRGVGGKVKAWVFDAAKGDGSLLRLRWIAIGSDAMKNVLKLMEAATGVLIALAILLAVIGAFYR